MDVDNKKNKSLESLKAFIAEEKTPNTYKKTISHDFRFLDTGINLFISHG